MSKELTEKKENALSTEGSYDAGSLGSEDIIIPRLHLLQGLSEGVAEGEYSIGDILHTGDQEVLGNAKESLEIIPFYMTKLNQVFNSEETPKEYIKTEPYTGKDWEEPGYTHTDRDGNTKTFTANNYKTFIMYGVLTNEDHDLPVSVTFRSSAGKDGAKIASHIVVNSKFGKPEYSHVWKLSSGVVKDSGKSFSKWVARRDRKTTDEEMEICAQWRDSIEAKAMQYAEQAATPDTPKSEEPKVVSRPDVQNFAPGAESEIPY